MSQLASLPSRAAAISYLTGWRRERNKSLTQLRLRNRRCFKLFGADFLQEGVALLVGLLAEVEILADRVALARSLLLGLLGIRRLDGGLRCGRIARSCKEGLRWQNFLCRVAYS